MRRTSLLLTFAVLPAAASAVETIETAGKIDAVTVYRGEALVTRLLELAGPSGLREVVVTGLPANVIPGSIHAESENGVEVRSVRYRVRPALHDVRDAVRTLDDKIRHLRDQQQANQRYLELMSQQAAYLDKLEQFVAPTAIVELTKGVLNAGTLKELSEFQNEQRKALAADELRLNLEQRDLAEQLGLLERERGELTEASSRTAREAVVLVNLTAADTGRVRVRYLVGQATWSPSYNIRWEDGRSDVLVEYNASIQQQSGEEWEDVRMTLSTATPSLVAKAPVLTPLRVALVPPSDQLQQRLGGAEAYHAEREQLLQRQQRASKSRAAPDLPVQIEGLGGRDAALGGNFAVIADEDRNLNEIAAELQNLDLAARGKITGGSRLGIKPDEGPTVVYEIAERTSLPSRSDRQLIRIAALPMPARLYKIATPVLTDYVYDEAEATNDSAFVLLAGPVASYAGGRFVGHGALPTVSIGQTFTVGLGIDSALRAGRELVDRTESPQGGNRVVDFTYRLTLENFGAQPAAVRLLDRLPEAERSQIRLTLTEPEPKLSEDPDYRHTDHKKGILRWEIEVPARATGPDATAIEYKFRLEYDRQMTVAPLAPTS